MTFDVAVVGAGPAGSAAASALARRGRRVALFERTDFSGPRVGESFGGEIGPLLAALGAETALAGPASLPFRGVRSAWGGAALAGRGSIHHPFGEGAHVDRARFDAALADAAAAAGASVRRDAGTCAVARTDAGVRVRPARGEPADARFLIDASGRGAPASAGLVHGRRWISCDQTVALVARFDESHEPDPDLLVESAPEGWWYSAPLPEGGLVVVLVTDADLVPAGARDVREKEFREALGRTAHTAARVHAAGPPGAVRTVRADTGRLVPDRAPGFAAVGDAALALDPLAGNGVARALRSGIETAAAVEAALAGEPLVDSGAAFLLESALDRRAQYYALERRWPDAPFWMRRLPPGDVADVITLHPDAVLRWTGSALGPVAHAKVEAFLPRPAIESALELLRQPLPAHAVLRALRDKAPIGDRRLLIGLQVLAALAPLETVDPPRPSLP